MTEPEDTAARLDKAARDAAAGMAPETPAPPGAPGAAARPEQPSTADVLAPLIGAAFRIVAPAWDVTKAEACELAGAWAPVLDKYFPGGLALSVEFNAVIVTLALLGPKWGKPRQVAAPVPADADKAPAPDAPLSSVGE